MASGDAYEYLGSFSEDELSPAPQFRPLVAISSGEGSLCSSCDDDDSDHDGANDGANDGGPSSASFGGETGAAAASAGRPNAARMHFDRAYERGRQCAANVSPSLSAGGSSSASLSKRGGRPSKQVLDKRREDGVNDALQGQDHQGRTHVLKHCRHPVNIDGEKCPCHFNLWARRSGSTGKEEIETHTRKWLAFSESRRREELTTQLQEAYSPDTNEWKYLIHGRRVCRSVFLLYYPISAGQLTKIQESILQQGEQGEEGEGGVEDGSFKDAKVWDGIVGWLLGYFEEIGDRVGCLAEGNNDETLIIPRMEKKLVWGEYKASEGEDACSESYFMTAWRTSPDLKHVEMARKVRNFQLCTRCHTISEGVTKALKSHNKEQLEHWRRIRREHHDLQRGERLSYYKRRREGSTDLEGDECLSIILDKWDSAKTTVPYWAREPSFLGPPEKHKMLQQHVLGVIVHGSPHSYYLYTFSDNLKGDSNMNIEGIRRTLVKHLAAGKQMPRILYIQADNASDNKNYAMLAFLACLVQHDYCHEVQLSFLLVGHTHEDIDQFFSVLTRHLARLGTVKTPQVFQEEIQKAATGKRRKVSAAMVDAALDWTTALKPFSNPTIAGIQRATFTTEETVDKEGNATKEDKEVRNPHVFRITKRARDGMAVMHYKEFSCDEVWLPPSNPRRPSHEWMTDPSGIDLFVPGDLPPDPVHISIRVAPYVS